MSVRPFAVASLILLCGASVAAQPAAKLDPLVLARVANLTGRSKVIVRAQNASQIGLLTTTIQLAGGTTGRQLGIIESIVADVPNISLTALSDSPLVKRIALDRRAAGSLERTGATIGSTAVRAALGLDGSGIGVAVIDSGITAWHDDLTGTVAGAQRVDQFVDFVNGQSTPYDDYGHGTHVAGIIAGNGFDSNGGRAGVAPGTRLVVLKVLDGAGHGRISDVIAGLDYAVAQKDTFNIRIINLSVAAGVFESYNSDLLTVAAKRAVEAGIVVVAAAGNFGKTSDGRTAYGGIGAPGNAPWVLTVGASSHQGTPDRSDDIIAAFSSRGPTAIDRAAKPDLVAPGVGIESLSDPQSALFASKTPYLLNGSVQTASPPYLSLSGTSQAAPVVAGTVALMLQANPSLTPNAVKAILQYTAEEYPGYDALTQGAGFVNAQGAVELARYFAQPTQPSPSQAGWSGRIIWGNHRIGWGVLQLAANAWGTNVTWGSAALPSGPAIAWGVMCSPPSPCEVPSSWQSWRVSCANFTCSALTWGSSDSENVVWGSACGGADCSSTPWTTTGNSAVASTSYDDDTVVWGTSDDGDTVVWGTSDDGDTVVWGTSAEDNDVVWGSSAPPPPPDASCEDFNGSPVI